MHLEGKSKQASKFHQLVPSPSSQDLESLAAEWELPSRWVPAELLSLCVQEEQPEWVGWFPARVLSLRTGVFWHRSPCREHWSSRTSTRQTAQSGWNHPGTSLAMQAPWGTAVWILDQTSTLPSMSSYQHQRKMKQCRSQWRNETSEMPLLSLGPVYWHSHELAEDESGIQHQMQSTVFPAGGNDSELLQAPPRRCLKSWSWCQCDSFWPGQSSVQSVWCQPLRVNRGTAWLFVPHKCHQK